MNDSNYFNMFIIFLEEFKEFIFFSISCHYCINKTLSYVIETYHAWIRLTLKTKWRFVSDWRKYNDRISESKYRDELTDVFIKYRYSFDGSTALKRLFCVMGRALFVPCSVSAIWQFSLLVVDPKEPKDESLLIDPHT